MMKLGKDKPIVLDRKYNEITKLGEFIKQFENKELIFQCVDLIKELNETDLSQGKIREVRVISEWLDKLNKAITLFLMKNKMNNKRVPRIIKAIMEHQPIRGKDLAAIIGKEYGQIRVEISNHRNKGWTIINGERGYTLKPREIDRRLDFVRRGKTSDKNCIEMKKSAVVLLNSSYKNEIKSLIDKLLESTTNILITDK